MDAYWIPIRTALAVFPLLAAFLTFPYMIYQYRRYGAIPFLRTVILYSFLLYLLCMYFLVILPLPSIEAVAAAFQDLGGNAQIFHSAVGAGTDHCLIDLHVAHFIDRLRVLRGHFSIRRVCICSLTS